MSCYWIDKIFSKLKKKSLLVATFSSSHQCFFFSSHVAQFFLSQSERLLQVGDFFLCIGTGLLLRIRKYLNFIHIQAEVDFWLLTFISSISESFCSVTSSIFVSARWSFSFSWRTSAAPFAFRSALCSCFYSPMRKVVVINSYRCKRTRIFSPLLTSASSLCFSSVKHWIFSSASRSLSFMLEIWSDMLARVFCYELNWEMSRCSIASLGFFFFFFFYRRWDFIRFFSTPRRTLTFNSSNCEFFSSVTCWIFSSASLRLSFSAEISADVLEARRSFSSCIS